MNVDNNHIEGYKNYMKLKGLAPRSISERLRQVKDFLSFLEELNLEPLQVTIKEAEEYKGYLMTKPICPETVINYMITMNSFFRYLKKGKLIYSNPFSEVPKPVQRQKLPLDIPGEKEMQQLLDWFMTFDKEPGHRPSVERRYKTHLVAELMYSTGMRIGEAAGLCCGDLDLLQGTALLRNTKNKRDRLCFINHFTKQILSLYLEEIRPLIIKGNTDSLFGMTVESMKNMINMELKKACAAVGIKPQGSKSFRHAVGTHFLRKGCSIRYIQSILGHQSIRSTEVYTKVVKEDLKKVIDRHHPRKWHNES